MRSFMVLAGMLLLAGCQKSFDDRYADAQKKIREQAASIDKELSDKASEAATGQAAATPTPTRPPSSAATASPSS